MRVLIVNASDTKGGAAIVARRLLHALNNNGVEAKMLVAEKNSNDEDVVALPRHWWIKKALDRFVIWAANGFTKDKLWLTDGGFFGNDITKRKEFQEADVIHLHWVNQGFLGLKDIDKILKSGKKVVWTMHDMWTATAVCHIPLKCDSYQRSNCKCCPLLKTGIPRLVFERKRTMFNSADNLRFIAVSQWVKDCFFRSCLSKSANQKCDVVGNIIPVEDFSYERKPRKGNEIVITMGAARLDDPIKGLSLLLDTLQECSKNTKYGSRMHLILYGGLRDKSLLERISIPYEYKGILTQKEVADVFRESDIVVSCSECETFGATLAEGISSGCIAVVRGIGGQKDIVEHKKTGYIVQNGESFANGLFWAMDNVEKIDRRKFHEEMTRKFSPNVIVHRHLEIYGNIR